jgi:hypothetical protein
MLAVNTTGPFGPVMVLSTPEFEYAGIMACSPIAALSGVMLNVNAPPLHADAPNENEELLRASSHFNI